MTEIVEVQYKRKPRKHARKGSKLPVTELLRSYGIPEHLAKYGSAILRYKAPVERGILWYWFSLYIRTRDKDKPCISCGRADKEDWHAGHFIPTGKAGWDGFVFNERNVHKECSFCNKRDKRKLDYEINLDKRYGNGFAAQLKEEYETYKKGSGYKNWNKAELKEKITYYKDQLSKLT